MQRLDSLNVLGLHGITCGDATFLQFNYNLGPLAR